MFIHTFNYCCYDKIYFKYFFSRSFKFNTKRAKNMLFFSAEKNQNVFAFKIYNSSFVTFLQIVNFPMANITQ